MCSPTVFPLPLFPREMWCHPLHSYVCPVVFGFSSRCFSTFLFIPGFEQLGYAMSWYCFPPISVLAGHWTSWICVFMIFINFGKFLTVFLQIFPPPPSIYPSATPFPCVLCSLKLSHNSLIFFVLFQFLFLCMFHFIKAPVAVLRVHWSFFWCCVNLVGC